MPFRIVPIVEGDGEVQAVGPLLRRLIDEFQLVIPIVVSRPIRQARGTLLKEGGIERAVDLACIEMGARGVVLVLIDKRKERGTKIKHTPASLFRSYNV